MKKLFALALVAIMALCMFACGSDYTAKNTEYFIGATGPLTGDNSSYGTSVQNGAQLAIEEINAAGGLNGVKFKFEIKDDVAAADKASTAYDQLYEAGMQIALGSVTSGSCAAFAAKAAEDKLFFMTPSASMEECIAESNAFRVCFGDPDQGKLAAEELAGKYKNIGVIYDESDDYSKGIYAAFETKMKELNAKFTVKTFDQENNRNFTAQVEALKACDVIFLPIYYTEASLIAQAAAEKGCAADLFGCDGLDGIADLLKEANVPNKIMYITPFDVNSEDVADFVAAYEAKYGVKPDQFAADGYDAVMVIYEAMKKAGVDDVTIDPATLCDMLVKVVTDKENFSYAGVTGDMTWETSGAAEKKPIIVELNK